MGLKKIQDYSLRPTPPPTTRNCNRVSPTNTTEEEDGDEEEAGGVRGEAEQSPPLLIRDDALCRLWHKTDVTYKMPKLNVSARMTTPVVYESPESAVSEAKQSSEQTVT